MWAPVGRSMVCACGTTHPPGGPVLEILMQVEAMCSVRPTQQNLQSGEELPCQRASDRMERKERRYLLQRTSDEREKPEGPRKRDLRMSRLPL
jgi:hypothetical protein